MRDLEIPHGVAGRTFLVRPSDSVNYAILAADTAKAITVPTGADAVVFSCVDASGNPASFYVAWSGTCTIPAADITDGSGPELNPTQRYIPGVTSFSVRAPAACKLMMAFYKVGS